MLIYKNETDKDIKLTLPPADGGDIPVEITVKPGEEYEIADEQAKFFLAYDLQAKATGDGEPADDTDGGDGAEEGEGVAKESEAGDDKQDKTEGEDENGEKDEEDEAAKAEEQKLADEKAKLAEEKRKLAEEKAEMRFNKLCESGKAVPAQKEAYMALAAHEGNITLAEGDVKSVSTLLENLFESAAAHSLNEEEGEAGEGESEVELSDEEKEVAERFGNTEEEIKANKEK